MSDPLTRRNAALEGRYTIERELGEGGMATVYLADDLKHQRKVALKVLKPELAAVVGAERFLAEITTTANLTCTFGFSKARLYQARGHWFAATKSSSLLSRRARTRSCVSPSASVVVMTSVVSRSGWKIPKMDANAATRPA